MKYYRTGQHFIADICPYKNVEGIIHVNPDGYVHLCQNRKSGHNGAKDKHGYLFSWVLNYAVKNLRIIGNIKKICDAI